LCPHTAANGEHGGTWLHLSIIDGEHTQVPAARVVRMHTQGVERETLSDDECELRGLNAQRGDPGHHFGQA
ncbi:MAG: hypothetical protein AVDCRST_MAG89-1165, partial [uncultured Gemmatimonadetes bacterium]